MMALSPLSPSQEPNAQNELMTALSALHVGGKYSDLTIQCRTKQWHVHKAIVCPRSGFFDGACSHQFKESTTGVVDLSEDDDDAVDQMIHYFYYLDYLNEDPEQSPSAMFRHRAYSDQRRRAVQRLDFSHIEDPLLTQAGLYDPSAPLTPPGSSHGDGADKAPGSPVNTGCMSQDSEMQDENDEEDYEEDDDTESESHLILHARVYALAEKYEIPALKQLARRKFEMSAACYYDAPELAEAILFVYTSTIDEDRGLRDVILQLFRSHPQLANTQDVYSVITETPSLALDLWKVERGLL